MSTLPRIMNSERGFTLIELMIVVVIIGILAAIAIPRFSGVAKAAKQSEAHLTLKQIYSLQTAYYQRRGVYATRLPADGDAPNIADLQGWAPPEMEFFQTPATADLTVNNSASPPTFCVGFEPNTTTGSGLEPRSVDHRGRFFASKTCAAGTEITL